MFAGILAVVVGGTVASAQYFSTAQKNALIKEDLTSGQVTAIDKLVAACREVIAEDPSPRGQSCADFRYKCVGTTVRCENYHSSTDSWHLIGSNANCDQSNGYGGHCGGEVPNCSGMSTGSTNATPGTATPEFNPTATINTTLRVGSSGVQVVALQQFLKAFGFYKGTVDGSFGSGTATAVAAWQASVGLKGDGVFGPDTRSVWQGASGKYYCKIPGQPSKICKQEGQPTGADCDPLPPTGDNQGCSVAGMYGTVTTGTVLMQAQGQTPTSSL